MQSIIINHQILKDLRKSRTIPLKAMAEKLGLAIKDYEQYELEDKEVTLDLAEKIASVFKRNWTVFLLNSLEKPTLYKQDNRTLDNKTSTLHLKTVEAIEDANYIFEFVKDLNTFQGLKLPKYENIKDLSAEALAIKLRNKSKITINDQTKFKDPSEAFRKWKKFIENLGIFVLQYPLSSEDKIRAFSVSNHDRAVIVLNTKDTQKARIFSLFHELCHILRRSSGICDLHNSLSSDVEVFCNIFAANFLAPSDFVNNYIESKGKDTFLLDLSPNVSRLASKLKVSELVIYRRFATLGLISDSYYSSIHNNIISKFPAPAPAPKKTSDDDEKGGPNYYAIKKARNGEAYSNVVIEAFNTGQINTIEASKALGISARVLPEYINKTAYEIP